MCQVGAVVQFNKCCRLEDWSRPEIQSILIDELKLPPEALEHQERKHWEWALGLYCLKYYGYLKPENRALGIACGHEVVLYALTKHLHSVTGIDLYGETSFAQKEAQQKVLEEPAAFAPFPYDQSKLHLKRMDARKLDFPDNSFDILFSFSSIEHLGSQKDLQTSMREAYRVLKPGGIYVLTVDYIFKQSWPHLPRFMRWREAGEYLTKNEVKDVILGSAPFGCKQDIDFDVNHREVINIYDCLTDQTSTGQLYPHIHLKFQKYGLRRYLFSSLFLALFKTPI